MNYDDLILPPLFCILLYISLTSCMEKGEVKRVFWADRRLDQKANRKKLALSSRKYFLLYYLLYLVCVNEGEGGR